MPVPILRANGPTKLSRERDRELGAVQDMQNKISHRAASALIDQAARESAYRYAAVTSWCGKVGTP